MNNWVRLFLLEEWTKFWQVVFNLLRKCFSVFYIAILGFVSEENPMDTGMLPTQSGFLNFVKQITRTDGLAAIFSN